MRRIIVYIWIMLVVTVSLPSLVVADEQTQAAQQLIVGITENATTLLSAKDKTLAVREKEFHAHLKQRIDFSFIAALVMGQHWNDLNVEQRSEFIDLFSNFFLNSYAALFGGYPGQITLLGITQKNGARDVFIRVDLKRPNRKVVVTDWRIRQFGRVSKIIDLSIAGESVVISHRRKFHQHIDKKGLEGLLNLLRVRANRLSAQS